METIKNLNDLMQVLWGLDNTEYLEANWIEESEVEELKADLFLKVKEYKEQFKEQMEFLSKRRQDLKMQAEWWLAESKRLKELSDNYMKGVERMEKSMDFFMKAVGEEKLDTSLYHLSYRKSESVEIKDENLLPSEFVTVTEVKKADKIAIKKAIKDWIDVPWATILSKENLQIK